MTSRVPRLTRDSTIDDVTRAVFSHAHAGLLRSFARSATVLDADAIHDARVAARRARSDLRTLRPLLDRSVTEPVRAELRWIGSTLGRGRDLDVIGDLVRAAAREHRDPGVGGVIGELDRQRAAAIGEIQRALGGERDRHLLAELDRLTGRPPIRSSVRPQQRIERAAPRLVRSASRHLHRELRTVRGPDDEEALHEVRKAAKRVRYAIELLAPVLDRPTVALRDHAKIAQQRLGAHRDRIAASEWLYAVGRTRSQLERAACSLACVVDQLEARDPLDWDELGERLRAALAGPTTASRR